MIRFETFARGRAVAAAVLSLYAILLGVATAKHVLWRDEAQAWLIARDSPSLVALVRNLRYEGHPPLWHFILFPLTGLTWNPAWMKLANLVFALAVAALLLFSRQLALSVRLALVFSYFLLFEYAVLARNYMLGVALLLAATHLLMHVPRRRLWTVALLLSLAALSSLPALILAVLMFCVYLNRELTFHGKAQERLRRPALKGGGIVGSLVFVTCALASVMLIRPPSDTGVFLLFPPLSHNPLKLFARCGSNLAVAYLPIPAWTHRFWNSSLIARLPHHLPTLLGWTLFATLMLYFERPTARYFFVGGSGLLLLQITLSQRSTMHNLGWLFICFVLGLLLEHAGPAADQAWGRKRLHWRMDLRSGWQSGWRSGVLGLVLCAQVYSGIFALGVSLRFPFSHSLDLALFFRRQGLGSSPLVFEPDYVGSAVLAYMQRRDDYDLESHRRSSFVIWDRREFLDRHVPTSGEWKQVDGGIGAPVLITEVLLTSEQEQRLGLHLLARYDDAICDLDNYYVYR